MTTKYIWITFSKEGVHCYPEAGEREDLKSVSFLAHPHRHIFHFKVMIEVDHSNRDLEFIREKRWMEKLYDSSSKLGVLQLDNKSCEMMAEELYEKMLERYGKKRRIVVEVSEDKENGCRIEFNCN